MNKRSGAGGVRPEMRSVQPASRVGASASRNDVFQRGERQSLPLGARVAHPAEARWNEFWGARPTQKIDPEPEVVASAAAALPELERPRHSPEADPEPSALEP